MQSRMTPATNTVRIFFKLFFIYITVNSFLRFYKKTVFCYLDTATEYQKTVTDNMFIDMEEAVKQVSGYRLVCLQ